MTTYHLYLSLSILALVVASATEQSGSKSGSRGGVFSTLEDQLQQVYWDCLMQVLNQNQNDISDYEFEEDGGHLKNNSYKVSGDAKQLQMYTEAQQKVISLYSLDMQMQFTSRNTASTFLGLPVKAQVDIKATEVIMSAQIAIIFQKTKIGAIIPALTVKHIDLNIPSESMEITISNGNIFAKIANIFQFMYKSTIYEMIDDYLKDQIKTRTPYIIGLTEVFDQIDIDKFLSTHSSIINDKELIDQAKKIIFNNDGEGGGIKLNDQILNLHEKIDVNAVVSDVKTVVSGVEELVDKASQENQTMESLIKDTFSQSQQNGQMPVFNTTIEALGQIIQGFAENYQQDRMVSIVTQLSDLSEIVKNPGSIISKLSNLTMEFWVEPPKESKQEEQRELALNVTMQGNIQFNEQEKDSSDTATLQINDIDLSQFEIAAIQESKIGEITPEDLTKQIVKLIHTPLGQDIVQMKMINQYIKDTMGPTLTVGSEQVAVPEIDLFDLLALADGLRKQHRDEPIGDSDDAGSQKPGLHTHSKQEQEDYIQGSLTDIGMELIEILKNNKKQNNQQDL